MNKEQGYDVMTNQVGMIGSDQKRLHHTKYAVTFKLGFDSDLLQYGVIWVDR
jgi:hypothetical protein